MEKISGIIPSSARVTNVDIKDPQNIRTTLPNRVEPAAGGKPEAMLSTQPGWQSKELKHSAIVTEVANNFFMKTKPEIKAEAEASEEPVHAPIPQPEGLFPKGSFIDRNA